MAAFTADELVCIPSVKELVLRTIWKELPELREDRVPFAERADRIAAEVVTASASPEAGLEAEVLGRVSGEALAQLASSVASALLLLAARRVAASASPPATVVDGLGDGAELWKDLLGEGLVPKKEAADVTRCIVWCSTLLTELAEDLRASGAPPSRWLEDGFATR